MYTTYRLLEAAGTYLDPLVNLTLTQNQDQSCPLPQTRLF